GVGTALSGAATAGAGTASAVAPGVSAGVAAASVRDEPALPGPTAPAAQAGSGSRRSTVTARRYPVGAGAASRRGHPYGWLAGAGGTREVGTASAGEGALPRCEAPRPGDLLFDPVAVGVPGLDPQGHVARGAVRAAAAQDEPERPVAQVRAGPLLPRGTVVVRHPQPRAGDGRTVRPWLVVHGDTQRRRTPPVARVRRGVERVDVGGVVQLQQRHGLRARRRHRLERPRGTGLRGGLPPGGGPGHVQLQPVFGRGGADGEVAEATTRLTDELPVLVQPERGGVDLAVQARVVAAGVDPLLDPHLQHVAVADGGVTGLERPTVQHSRPQDLAEPCLLALLTRAVEGDRVLQHAGERLLRPQLLLVAGVAADQVLVALLRHVHAGGQSERERRPRPEEVPDLVHQVIGHVAVVAGVHRRQLILVGHEREVHRHPVRVRHHQVVQERADRVAGQPYRHVTLVEQGEQLVALLHGQ